jgi:hypothetical protein
MLHPYYILRTARLLQTIDKVEVGKNTVVSIGK